MRRLALAALCAASAARAGVSVPPEARGNPLFDQANAVLLDLFADVAKQNGAKDRRFRIEHVQHLRPEDYKRFKELGVTISSVPIPMVRHIDEYFDYTQWVAEEIMPAVA